ncbi:NAD(P)/FAD-dependent oxidoreductase [Sulfobacillus thermosulfidooxidans]|uniref:NAD(P)/FAD-dependent oxidoreductase n=1 Tax=Sulfobacillus thermosulfidooxidans TaxID=28034 RepID=UPI0006B5C4F2|nr:FAD/NAD(P)-binding oxidoreductase [Sulfobacillus thermosulfidooxidans]
MQKVVILGGGVGGTIVANQVARQMGSELKHGDVEITVISESAEHVYQPMFLYMAFDQVVPSEAKKPEREILDRHVKLVHGSADRIDRDAKAVIMADGSKIPYDYLVIATGSRPAPELIDGLPEGGHIFYTEEGALKLRQALHDFNGGRIVVTVGVPHKCPVAPLEFTFMVQEWAKAKGIGDKTEVVYTYPIGRLHSLEPVAKWAAPVFEERHIESHVFFNPEKVDPKNKTITSIEGETLDYDLLVAIPPHTGQDVIGRSEIGDAGKWIPTNRHTLRMEGADDIFVLGDATNLPISKAGSTAHFEADVVAANLVNLLRGGLGSIRYDGKVFCFIETGLKSATYITFDYNNPPNPPEPTEMIHMYKLAYNRMYWLTPAGLL